MLPGIARVLPDLTGLDKAFDYAVPADLAGRLQRGDVVRVDLHGRRVRGWVIALDPPDAQPGRSLFPIVRWSSRGPDPTLIELAEWASVRWAAGRLRPFLVTATPPANVTATLPAADAAGEGPSSPAQDVSLTTVRLGPTVDPLPLIEERIRGRAALVIHPSVPASRALSRRLERRGVRVAWWPEQWELAARGVDVVVGTRAAAWARLPVLDAVVLLDEHDEALQEERTPTWHARDVLVERARRSAATCALVSPAPTATAVWLAGGVRPAQGAGDERDTWPVVEVVDRSDEAPWKRSLVSTALITALRDHGRRVMCVINAPGRSRRLACRRCANLQRCTTCGAAVAQADDGTLVCASCATTRPPLCQVCASTALANVRPGVTRLRDELEAAANRPVAAVTAAAADPVGADARVFVGTEAVLHRVGRVDTVAFLDFDAELLAPRYRAAEQAMGLLVRAARHVGGRRGTGRILIQTHLPGHPVIAAVRHADLAGFTRGELERRRELSLPPWTALAALSGAGQEEMAESLGRQAPLGVAVAPGAHRSLVRAPDWSALGTALLSARSAAGRVRIEVDPPR